MNGENIAVLPNDDDGSSSGNITAVSINTVNALRNSQYFHENTFIVEDGRSPYPNIEADGFTTILTARGIPKQGVGQWNHIKLAITDVGDNLYDSYVLIAALPLLALRGLMGMAHLGVQRRRGVAVVRKIQQSRGLIVQLGAQSLRQHVLQQRIG